MRPQTYYRWRKEYGGYEYNASTQTERPGKREPPTQETGRRFVIGQCHLEGGAVKKVDIPGQAHEQAVNQVMEMLECISSDAPAGLLDSPGQRNVIREGLMRMKKILREQIVSLASRHGRYGYRRVTAMLRNEGWLVNHKRVERIWRQEGLKVPSKQPKRSRLWLNDGSIVRLRPAFPKHVWSYDFMHDRTHNGVSFSYTQRDGMSTLGSV